MPEGGPCRRYYRQIVFERPTKSAGNVMSRTHVAKIDFHFGEQNLFSILSARVRFSIRCAVGSGALGSSSSSSVCTPAFGSPPASVAYRRAEIPHRSGRRHSDDLCRAIVRGAKSVGYRWQIRRRVRPLASNIVSASSRVGRNGKNRSRTSWRMFVGLAGRFCKHGVPVCRVIVH